MEADKPGLYIVDDDEAVREGLQALLRAHGYAVETFASAASALDALDRGGSPACLLVDVRMPGMSGLELQREARRRAPALPVIMITADGDIPMAVGALKAGAADFLEKPFDADVLLASVTEALRPKQTAPGGGQDLAEIRQRVAELTPREREVMDLVIAGHSNKVIAHRLQIAVRTVEIHRGRVMEKTGARSLADLVRMAIRLEQAGSG
jgi:two-component system response regulator FixJ